MKNCHFLDASSDMRNLITWSASLMKCLLTVVWAENNSLTNKQWTNQCPLYDPRSSDDLLSQETGEESPAKYLPGDSQGITSYTSLAGSSTTSQWKPEQTSSNRDQTSIGSSFLRVGEFFFLFWVSPFQLYCQYNWRILIWQFWIDN